MANPTIKVKRSAISGKIPSVSQIDLGEFAINTFDGKVYIEQDKSSVGVGTTIVVINPWNVGTGTNTYNTFFTSGNVGVGITLPTSNLHVNGNSTITGILTVGSGSVTTLETTDLTVTNQITGISSGAAKVDTATDAGNQWHHVAFLDNQTGYQKLKTNGLTYNPNIGKLYAGIGSFTTVTGNLTGNVIGNIVGNVTGNINSTGISTISGFTFPGSDGTNGQVLGTNGAGQLAFITASSTGSGTTITNLSWTVGVGSTAFQSPYSIEENTTIVFNNGLKLALNSDYYINSNTIFIKNGPLQQNDRVHATIHYDTSFDSEVFTATNQQTTFTLAATILSSQDRAKVYLNGVKLRNEIDYTISQTIQLNFPTESEDLINISSDSGDSYTIASQGQTSFGFTSSGINASNLLVYQNGIRLEPDDYSIGSLSIILIFAASQNDTLEVLLYS